MLNRYASYVIHKCKKTEQAKCVFYPLVQEHLNKNIHNFHESKTENKRN